jgi:hypothetical protein
MVVRCIANLVSNLWCYWPLICLASHSVNPTGVFNQVFTQIWIADLTAGWISVFTWTLVFVDEVFWGRFYVAIRASWLSCKCRPDVMYCRSLCWRCNGLCQISATDVRMADRKPNCCFLCSWIPALVEPQQLNSVYYRSKLRSSMTPSWRY